MYNWDEKSHIYIGYMDNWCKKAKFTSAMYKINEKKSLLYVGFIQLFIWEKMNNFNCEMKNVPNFVAEISFEYFYIYEDKKYKMC